MTYLSSLLLGVIEGLTEFFPISSTGHLVIAQRILGITTPSLFFNVTIQVGAILAAVYYYRKRIREMLAQAAADFSWRSTLVFYGVATLPALVAGALFHSLIESLQTSVHVVAFTTIGVALYLAWIQRAYRASSHAKTSPRPVLLDFLAIGAYQAISIIPGVSRSGVTISGALTRKFTFKDATDTAFILAIPVMTAAAGYESLKLLRSPMPITDVLFINTFIGFITAFFVALATIKVTVPILKKYGFTPFILYRLVLGAAILLFLR